MNDCRYSSLILWLWLLPSLAHAQFHTQHCKDAGLSGQVCIAKDKDKNQSFGAAEIPHLVEIIKKNPGFPWIQVIDQNHELAQDLEAECNEVDKAHRTRYLEIIKNLKAGTAKSEEALEAIHIFLKTHAHHKMTLNNSDRELMEKAVSLLNGKDQSAGIELGAGPGAEAGKR